MHIDVSLMVLLRVERYYSDDMSEAKKWIIVSVGVGWEIQISSRKHRKLRKLDESGWLEARMHGHKNTKIISFPQKGCLRLC